MNNVGHKNDESPDDEILEGLVKTATMKSERPRGERRRARVFNCKSCIYHLLNQSRPFLYHLLNQSRPCTKTYVNKSKKDARMRKDGRQKRQNKILKTPQNL